MTELGVTELATRSIPLPQGKSTLGPSTRKREVKHGFVGGILFCAVALMSWGPPPLRLHERALELALDSPFSLDLAALVHAGIWMGSAGIVAIALAKRVLLPSGSVANVLLSEPALRWYLGFGVVAVGSAAYSVSPAYSAFFALKIWIAALAVALLVCEAGAGRALRALYATAIIQVLAVAVLFLFDPLLAGVQEMSGYRLHGGVLRDYGVGALLASVLSLKTLIFSPHRRKRLLAGIALTACAVAIVLSRTRSTLLVFIAFVAVMIIGYPRFATRFKLFVLACLFAVGIFLTGIGGPLAVYAARGGVGVETLSGRTVAFSYLLERWRESPLAGVGYGAGSRDSLVDFVHSTGLGIGAGHDLLSTALVDVGVVGTLLVLLALLASWMTVMRVARPLWADLETRPAVLETACLLIWATASGVVSAGIARASVPFLIACVLLAECRAHHAERIGRSRRSPWQLSS